MLELLKSIIDTRGFPQRWYCGTAWTPELGWTHIISDVVIFISYISIPISIYLLTRNRKYIRYQAIIWLFMAFIIACGVGHLIEATIFWHPWYRLSALSKAITAIISVITTLALLFYALRLLKVSDDLKQRDYLKHIITSIPHPVLVLNQKLEIIFSNKEFSNYTGYRIEDLLGKKISIFFSKEYETSIEAIAANCFNDKINHIEVVELYNCEGNITHAEMNAIYINHMGDEELLVSFKDLENSMNLSTLSDKLKTILNGATDAIIISDTNGIIHTFNKAALNLFGYEEIELVGKSFNDLISGGYVRKHIIGVKNKNITKKIDSILKGVTKTGAKLKLEISSGTLQTATTQIHTVFVRDISSRIEMENKIQTAYADLESFSFVAAHDLKEPLRGISNYCQFLIEDYEEIIDKNGLKMLSSMQKLCKRLEQFIEDLLHYYRVGKSEKIIDNIDVNDLLSDVLLSINITITNEKVKITKAKNFPTIKAQKVKIREVFYNLITNAIKYNTSTEKHIKIGYKRSNNNSENPYIFYVKDNGIGIKPEHEKIVYEMFKRLHGKNEFNGGSGAGLAIVKKIIEQHNGRLWLESKEGEGTTFYFTLNEYE